MIIRAILLLKFIIILFIIQWKFGNYINWSTIFIALGALGSIGVTIAAIWGDYFKSKYYGPKLTIEPHNLLGDIAH